MSDNMNTQAQPTHCDDIIHNYNYPLCLRYFVLVHRLPATDHYVLIEKHGYPKCFATYKGQRVRLNMCSRFGDIGVRYSHIKDTGYDQRVIIDDLSDFSETP